MNLQGIPDDILLKELEELNNTIFESTNCGIPDMVRYARVIRELCRRGYMVNIAQKQLVVTHA